MMSQSSIMMSESSIMMSESSIMLSESSIYSFLAASRRDMINFPCRNALPSLH